MDWFCWPRFDSPSVCASLLDADHGGCFRVGPDRDDYVNKQLYFPDTAMLITWIRDGSFSIYALLGLGFVEEAAAFAAGCGTAPTSGQATSAAR